jgi:subtilisin family serine protease
LIGVVAAAALTYPTAASASSDPTAGAPDGPAGDGTYVVQLADEPVATYEGAVAGLRATRPAAGAKVDRTDPDVRKYVKHLDSRRGAVLSRVKGAKKLYDYNFTFAGFAAELTGKQAAALATAPGVVSVTRDEVRQLDTISTPGMLGLTGPNGVWAKEYGSAENAGRDVIVGIVDSGLWPENPSFAAVPKSWSDVTTRYRFKGICDAGLEAPQFTCNNKVIGARYFVKGIGPDRIIEREYLSPRGWQSHGSHTAATAAGNTNVTATVDGTVIGKASGMAPAAKLAVYKVCWATAEDGTGGCNTTDSVAAIDAAVADGVDVINFSISGSRVSNVDPVELAFFRAAQAGVFVATSAGNNGPTVGTVAHNDPWVTTVAAGTTDRAATAKLILGNGKSYTGVGSGNAVPSAPLILSTAAAKADAAPADAALCFPGTLDPAKTGGRIVVCDRGVNARNEKSLVVKDAGGVGMVLVNTGPNSLNADLHYVPTVHLDNVAGAEVKTYAATADATAELEKAVVVTGAPAPKVAAFSSRGPALAASGDLLKPDIMAPGADILAAVSPQEGKGRNWDLLSGTSMAAPHIAGLAALVIGKHPKWSPMAVKSALLTTATTRDNQGQAITTDSGGLATARDYGAGHVVPAKSFLPGLVYDSGSKDWVQFLCGSNQLPLSGPDCTKAGGPIDPSDLNGPSIAIGALAGIQTVTRTVTSVASKPQTYVVSVQEPPGVEVTVSPTRFTIDPGKKKSFTVTVKRVSAPFDDFVYGAVTWSDGKHVVRSPLGVRPVAVASPVEVKGTGATGTVKVPVTAGYTGTLTASVAGPVPSDVTTQNLKNPTGQSFPTTNPAATEHTAKVTVTVPTGTRLARFATFDADYPDGTDLDVFVYRAGGTTLLASSAGATSEETVNLVNPSGSYDVYVNLYAIGGGGTSLDAKLNSWSLGTAPTGSATATPASQPVTIAVPTSVDVAWSGLEPGRRWLGRVIFTDGGTASGSTLFRIDS